MAFSYIKELEYLLTVDAFKVLVNSDAIKIGQLHAIIDILIKARIPFVVNFSPANREDFATIRLTISINPSTQLTFTLILDCGSGLAGGALAR